VVIIYLLFFILIFNSIIYITVHITTKYLIKSFKQDVMQTRFMIQEQLVQDCYNTKD